ncbi:MAG: CRISPR-associated helicase Cas3' [Anaerolineaceae bacterium]
MQSECKDRTDGRSPTVFELWAKSSTQNPLSWHPLIWHLLDASAVAQLLWKHVLSESYKISVASELGLSDEDTGTLISFWVGLHDIGKAGPAFQTKNTDRGQRLEQLGYDFPKVIFKTKGFHATATTLILKQIFPELEPAMPIKFMNRLAIALGGHHGEFPNNGDLLDEQVRVVHLGNEKWQSLQSEIFLLLEGVYKPKLPSVFPTSNEEQNPLFLLLTGLTTVADWISSNEIYFPYQPRVMEPTEYLGNARTQAYQALKSLGWLGWRSENKPISFKELFPEFAEPNSIQQSAIDHSLSMQSPFLVILEAPTGSGKTEAAFYLADTAIQRDRKAGIYLAMPTQATSNQMYSRIRSFLAKRYLGDEINLHLVHGAAFLKDNSQAFTPSSICSDEDQRDANIQSHTWFLPRKRTLLAPFGVGTVDQTFLSVMKTRHFFLRLFGLSHKVLIFDEVHAYDTYMTAIFKDLLHWLHAVGTSVIILSATLPVQTRQELLESYSGKETNLESVPFPRLSIVTDQQINVCSAGEVSSRKVRLGWIGQEPEDIVKELKDRLQTGGCAAVICNRVNRAQEIFTILKQSFSDEQVELFLFHSRFPYLWRSDIETRVLGMFGKEDLEKRPKKAILVATQVIEQSLDLDFDLMVSDLAPIDLLVQRIGRLHRHSQLINPPIRMPSLAEPRFIIAAPPSGQGEIPEFGKDSYVYEPYILAKTLLTIKGRDTLYLPEETDALIESVYSSKDAGCLSDIDLEKLAKLKKEMLEHQVTSTENAQKYLIPHADKTFFGSLNTFFSDDLDSLSRKVLAAPTREIEASVQVVCFTQEEDGLHILGDVNTVDMAVQLTDKQVRSCLMAALTINDKRILHYFFNSDFVAPEAFRTTAALRWHIPLVFTGGIHATDHFDIVLNKETGIQIIVK